MMVMLRSKSYREHHSGADCALLNSDPGNPCWGQVRVVETIDGRNEEKEKAAAYLFACAGHVRKVKYSWREPYEKEPKQVAG